MLSTLFLTCSFLSMVQCHSSSLLQVCCRTGWHIQRTGYHSQTLTLACSLCVWIREWRCLIRHLCCPGLISVWPCWLCCLECVWEALTHPVVSPYLLCSTWMQCVIHHADMLGYVYETTPACAHGAMKARPASMVMFPLFIHLTIVGCCEECVWVRLFSAPSNLFHFIIYHFYLISAYWNNYILYKLNAKTIRLLISANCEPKCKNRGECLRPGKCRCPPGLGGKYCEKGISNVSAVILTVSILTSENEMFEGTEKTESLWRCKWRNKVTDKEI